LEGAGQRFATLLGIGQKTEKFNTQTIVPDTRIQLPASSHLCGSYSELAKTKQRTAEPNS
jgi:hypothetical protein